MRNFGTGKMIYFRENHKILSVFAKIFATRILFLQKQQLFSNCVARCSYLTYIEKNLGKTNIFAWISCHQNIFTKMVPLFHMVLTSFAFFLRNLKTSQLLFFFAKIFGEIVAKILINFAYFWKQMFAQMIFTKMRKRKIPFQSYKQNEGNVAWK